MLPGAPSSALFDLNSSFALLSSGLVHGRLPQQPLRAGVQVDAGLHDVRQLHVPPAAPPVVRNRSGRLQWLYLLQQVPEPRHHQVRLPHLFHQQVPAARLRRLQQRVPLRLGRPFRH